MGVPFPRGHECPADVASDSVVSPRVDGPLKKVGPFITRGETPTGSKGSEHNSWKKMTAQQSTHGEKALQCA